MVNDALHELDASALGDLMATGDASSVEVVAALLRRIETVDQGEAGVHAVLEANPDALADARAADDERARGAVRGWLHGVPVLIKDNIDTAAPLHTTAGSWALRETQPYVDAPVVRALRDAGAIILGKANLSEWANYRSSRSTSGWSAVGSLTRNPHDLSRSAGGSSSGSAAAVAAFLAPLSVGTETDGSIICPAAFCGVVGVKPTVGLVPAAGVVPIAHSQDSVGPMARTVRDAALLLAVLAGVAPGTYDPRLAESTAPLRGLRIGVPRGQLWTDDAGVAALTEAAIALLSAAGATIIDDVHIASLGSFDPADELVVLDHELKADLAAYLATRPPGGPRSLADVIAFNLEHADRELVHFDQDIFERAERTTGLASADYVAARARCIDAARTNGLDATLAMHELDALVMPSPGPAWPIDLVNGDAASQRAAAPSPSPAPRDFEPLGATSLPAMAGYPAVTVPSGVANGLPAGLMITGPARSEAVLLRIAAAYESLAELASG